MKTIPGGWCLSTYKSLKTLVSIKSSPFPPKYPNLPLPTRRVEVVYYSQEAEVAEAIMNAICNKDPITVKGGFHFRRNNQFVSMHFIC
jgi:hypothetical protein